MIDRQKGGAHYTAKEIQPWDIILSYELDFFAGNVIKYLLRSAAGNPSAKHPTPEGRLTDLRKALHYCEKLVELAEDKIA